MTTMMPATVHPFITAAITISALGVACALLSVFVVLRRWAFIGEAIAHSGFGGAGMAWIAILLWPQLLGAEQTPLTVSAAVAIMGIIVALLIGYFSNRARLNFDAAVGTVLVASVAWGFLAQNLYVHVHHAQPWGFESVILGSVLDVTFPYALLTVAICLSIILIVALFWKELLSYVLDPVGAQVSGVRAGMMHYLLLLMIAGTLIVGIRLSGALLVTALIVLPGVIGLLLSQQIARVLIIAIAAGLIGTVGGLIIHELAPFVPIGPAMTLLLLLEFIPAFIISRLRSST
ncbi:MAG: metal ABC transporter permease [Phycisphaerales bacterium]|nr:metal ABC transporter permease [Phycisphaerales bacterium]